MMEIRDAERILWCIVDNYEPSTKQQQEELEALRTAISVIDADQVKGFPNNIYKAAYGKIWDYIFDIETDDEDLIAALKIACGLLHEECKKS